ncbi:MAG: DUF447 domain-containing protein [Planctomycetota bacterium]
MILESIVTSANAKGNVNIAPMGPIVQWDLAHEDPIGQRLCLRPFQSSRTYRNLMDTRLAVVHVTDDVELLAKAAVDAIEETEVHRWVEPMNESGWWKLRDCHRYFAIEIESIDDNEPRTTIMGVVRQSQTVRPFFGFNRAKHAVIEAAILATRTHLIDESEIQEQLDRLRPLIEKTGGANEVEAFEFLQRTIDSRLCER